MYVMNERIFRIAILDLYDGFPNQGMRCIRELIKKFATEQAVAIEFYEFDVRKELQIPDTQFDAYISSGGPGSPLDSVDTEWENKYFNWLSQIEEWNNSHDNLSKKQVLFICHSFQLACRYYNAGLVCKRKSTSFGVFPVHMIEEVVDEPLFEGLRNPFFAVDSRDYQVIQPNYEQLDKIGGKVLSIEKERPHVPYDRAVMAIRFNEHFLGTQFHPEADPIGMSMYLQTEEKKKAVIDEHGEAKWESMVEHLQDPDKIVWTYNHIIPNFLHQVVNGGSAN